MSYIREAVAAEIRAEMARQRKLGVGLASVLNTTQQSASRRMNAEVDLTLDEIAAIAAWLRIPFMQLLSGVPPLCDEDQPVEDHARAEPTTVMAS